MGRSHRLRWKYVSGETSFALYFVTTGGTTARAVQASDLPTGVNTITLTDVQGVDLAIADTATHTPGDDFATVADALTALPDGTEDFVAESGMQNIFPALIPMRAPAGTDTDGYVCDRAPDGDVRVANNGANDGAITVYLHDAETGDHIGTWESPVIPAGGSIQVPVSALENNAGHTPGAGQQYNIRVDGGINGYVQHVM